MFSAFVGSFAYPFIGLWIVTGLPVLELVLADTVLILVGAAMVAASRR